MKPKLNAQLKVDFVGVMEIFGLEINERRSKKKSVKIC